MTRKLTGKFKSEFSQTSISSYTAVIEANLSICIFFNKPHKS